MSTDAFINEMTGEGERDDLDILVGAIDDYMDGCGQDWSDLFPEGGPIKDAYDAAHGEGGMDRHEAAKILANYLDEQAEQAGQGLDELYGGEVISTLAKFGYVDDYSDDEGKGEGEEDGEGYESYGDVDDEEEGDEQ